MKILTAVISFWVKVPVLSAHITVILPRVSTARSFLTIAFLLTILFMPRANTIVTIAGNPSGIAATARLIETINISIIFLPCNIPTVNTIIHTIIVIIPRYFPRAFNFFCKGVNSSSKD